MQTDLGDRHFERAPIVMTISYVRANLGEEAVHRMLRLAGETGPPEELLDDARWCSYSQMRRFLEAAAVVLGGSDELRCVGRALIEVMNNPAGLATLQQLPSPNDLFARVEQMMPGVSTVVSVWGEALGEDRWAFVQRFDEGFEAFPEFCAYLAGVFESVPSLFGMPCAEVVQERCECEGAPSCRLLVRWSSVPDDRRRAEFFETRVHLLEGQLETMRTSIGDLVSVGDIDELLERVMASTSRTVIVPAFVLSLFARPAFEARVAAKGLSMEEAQVIADRLVDGESDWDADWMVAAVASQRCTYGWLVAIRRGGAMAPFEIAGLEAYASLVAAALDSSMAIDTARREANVAYVLLELSRSLAEIVSVDEMAARVVRTVPAVVGSDAATLALLDDGVGVTAHVVATHGYSPEADSWWRDQVMTMPATDEGRSHFLDEHGAPGDGRTALRETDSVAGAWVPIVVDGAVVGALITTVSHDVGRLQHSEEIDRRLRGLASQAATSIRNARLLDQVRHQALHDSLTGLPNRALILDRVHQMLARARRTGDPMAAMFIDLDGFKAINDTFGHGAGDQLLRAVSERLAAALRQSDTIGRLGGDEFVVLVEGSSLDAGPELIAERILTVLREPFEIEGRSSSTLHVTASIGVAIGLRDSPGELLRDADIALYGAKDAGKDCFVVFEPAMQSAVQDRLLMQMDLQRALERDEFFLVYQPVSNLRSGVVTGVEALVRWRRDGDGVVQPDTFIPLLEESGMIVDVGRWVLREACRQAVEWARAGRTLDMAVNVSARQLQSDRFLDDIEGALRESGLDPGLLMIEITETAIMRDTEATATRLRRVKQLGVRVAIDDFGTGYSSLAYLRQFPVDTLKIDQSFVAALGDSAEASALMHTLVQLGKTLGLETLAEGIEELPQLDHLRAEDCDAGQGFLFAHPLTSAELERYLDERAPLPDVSRR